MLNSRTAYFIGSGFVFATMLILSGQIGEGSSDHYESGIIFWTGRILLAVGLLLGILQPYVGIPDRAKLASVALYVLGGVLFGVAVFENTTGNWKHNNVLFLGVLTAGSIALAAVFILNLVGLFRAPSKWSTQ